MGKITGTEPEQTTGFEDGISEEDTYVCVVVEYQDLGEGEYGHQGILICQVDERHPNGKPKETWVYFDHTTLGTEEKPSKIRQIANAIAGKPMPQSVAEGGFDPANLEGKCFRALLKNKSTKKGRTVIAAENFLSMRGADPIKIDWKAHEPWWEKKFNENHPMNPNNRSGNSASKQNDAAAEFLGDEDDDDNPW